MEKFELHTIKPAGYPKVICLLIFMCMYLQMDISSWNRVLFDDDERLVGKIRENSIRNDFMISKPEKTGITFCAKIFLLYHTSEI
jgi:hypothetical protein